MAVNTAEAGRSVTSKITSILLTFTQGNEHSLTRDRPTCRAADLHRASSDSRARFVA